MSIRHNNLDYRFSPISVINRYNSHDCYRFLSIDYSGYSYHGAPMRALRSRSLRCNQNLHYAQKPGRKTGSKQGDSLVSPLPLHKLSKLQYVPCYDWCNDIFSKSGFPRTPGVVFGTTGYIHAQNLIISKLGSPRTKSVKKPLANTLAVYLHSFWGFHYTVLRPRRMSHWILLSNSRTLL